MKKEEKVKSTKKIQKKVVAKKVVKTAIKKPKVTKYQRALEKVDTKKIYSVEEGIKSIKESSYAKFDASIDLQIKLLPAKKKEQIALRGTIKLPAGATKTKKIVVASDSTLSELEKGKINFDMLLATPETMPKLAKYAKTLGPKGLMPSPKSGTVTSNPEETLKELQSGLVEYKTDAHGIIHLPVGKKSWSDDKIKENIETVLRVLPAKQISTITLSATMSPGIRIKNI